MVVNLITPGSMARMMLDCVFQDFPTAVVDAQGKVVKDYHLLFSRDTVLLTPVNVSRIRFEDSLFEEHIDFLFGITCPASGGIESEVELLDRAFDLMYLSMFASYLKQDSALMNLCRDKAWNITDWYDIKQATAETIMYGHAISGFQLHRSSRFVPDIMPITEIRKDLYSNDWDNWAEGEDIKDE